MKLNHLMRKIGTSLFIMSFCLSSVALGMEDIKEEVTRHDVKMIVTKHLEKNPELMDASIGKDIVVFLGNTGAGKSTLINYLSEKELDVGQFKKIVLKNPNDPSALEIGGTKDSVTLLPRSVKVSNLLLYDLPGFGDTRGTAINLVNACFIKRIIENASSTKLVFVAGQDQITANRGKSFQGLLEITQKLLPEEQIVKFSSLIITKSDQDREELVPYLKDSVDLTDSLLYWMKNGNIAQMSCPQGKKINQDDRQNILETVKKIASKKIEHIDIGVIYDVQDTKYIKEFL